MKILELKLLVIVLFVRCFSAALFPVDRKQFAYLKAVRCTHNPKFLTNVTCYAKSYSRTISTMNILATMVRPVTSVLMDFEMFYKYGTIYREVLHSPFRFDFCYFMLNLEEFRTHPLGNEFIKIMEESIPGFVRPCPWKEIRAVNASIQTGNLASIWPSGDYKAMFNMYHRKEDYMNVTFIGSFRTPLKETFG